MKKFFTTFTIMVSVLGMSNMAVAQPYSGDMATDNCETEPGTAVSTPCQNGGNPEVYEAIEYVLGIAGKPSLGLDSNADTDVLQTPNMGYWNLFGGGDSSGVAVIAIGAENMNTLGVFPTGDPGSFMPTVDPQTGFSLLGDGSELNPFPGGMINQPGDFGFALRSEFLNGDAITWYSDPTLNSDGIDHMLAFMLPQLSGGSVWINIDGDPEGDEQIVFGDNTFLFSWEDLPSDHSNFDNDYNDTFFLITRLDPDPVVPEPMTMVLFGSGMVTLFGVRRKNKIRLRKFFFST